MSEWNEAEQHAERAQQFYRAGQWERALEELRSALQHRPDEGEWLFGLGLTLDALQRYEEAAEAFEKALAIRGEDVPGLLHLGIDLIRAGQPEAALDALERVNQLDPTVELGYAHRILAHTLLDQHEDAETMFYLTRQFAEEETQDPQTQAIAYDYLAQSLMMRGDHDRAMWCWQETLRLDPAHPEANRGLALLHQKRGQSERARVHYMRQLRLTPNDVETLLDCGDMLFASHRLAEAGEKYRRAIECDGTLAIAHQRLGELALINGHRAAAADRYERARQLDPTLPGIHLGLATAAHQRGDHAQASRWLFDELDREGQSPEQVLDIANLLVDLGEYHEAIRLLTPLLSGADDLLIGDDNLYANALLCRGVARIAEGDLEDGIRDCERCLQLAPKHAPAMQQLAFAHLNDGNLGEAQDWLKRGLTESPYDPSLRRLRRKLRLTRLKHGLRRMIGRSPRSFAAPSR